MNSRLFSALDITPDSPEWLDWRWQYRNRITDVEELAEIISLSDRDKRDIEGCLAGFRMAITPYYASLMDPENPMCPIRLQAVPSMQETLVLPWETRDPLSEERDSPVTGVVHRYPDRVLLLVTRQCAAYCRHCVRKRQVGEEDYIIGEEEIEGALDYISRTPQIRDILISGGDPLTMADDRLESIIARLRAIEHVEIIRIGTRVPATLPMRITPNLLGMLKKYHPLWINTHFNHPSELTALSVQACEHIVDAGIPLGNQSVLLKNINDNTETMRQLLLGLVKARVRPYYIYQCDLCEGVGHFRTSVQTGIDIIRDLTGNISGFAVPRYVIDAPGGGGKIPVNPETIVGVDDGKLILRNYEGRLFTYPQPE